MSKGTYSHSNRHRMHEQQVTNYDEVAHLKGVIAELKKENTELKHTLSTIMDCLYRNPSSK